jgi:hypothetical protein
MKRLIKSASLVLVLVLVSLVSQAENLKWLAKIDPKGGGKIVLDSKATLLGKTVPVRMEFTGSRDQPSRQSWGAIGFALTVAEVDKLNGFHFTEFEGPDAPGGEFKVLVKKKNGTEETFRFNPSGSFVDVNANSFAFGLYSSTQDKKSIGRQIFQSILKDSSSLELIITDPKDTSKKLRVEYQTADLKKPLQELLNSLN